MKRLTGFANTTFFVLLSAKSAGYMAGAALLFALAAWLAYVLQDAGLFLVIPAVIAWKGTTVALQGLEPFATKQPKPDPAPSRGEKGPPREGRPADLRRRR
jgi:hypothetical protein